MNQEKIDIEDLTPVMPRKKAPPLEVMTTSKAKWKLADLTPKNFTLVIVYRGLHCPICANYLKELENNLDIFNELGVEVIAISSDNKDRAHETVLKWNLDKLTIGYGLTSKVARSWGIYLSSGRKNPAASISEPSIFVEPGVFLIRNDGTIFMSATQTMPFARLHISDILDGIRFIIENDYPARGEIV